MSRTALYNSYGETLTHWDVDVEAATLTRREAHALPSVVQYAWPHPSNRYLYATTTDSARGSRGITGAAHLLSAFRVGPDGALVPHGAPKALRQRAIHTSVDRSGQFVLTAYNAPPHLTVHRLHADGTLGDEIPQPADLDLGIFCHQILAMPSNRAVTMVTRGNNPGPGKPQGDPGAIKVYGFDWGRLSPAQNVTAGHPGGFGYGPRHLDFHPTKPWVYVIVELQNELHMHRLVGDRLEDKPDFAKPCTLEPPKPGIVQVSGAIHVHPRGHVVYLSNRVSATTNPDGPFPFVDGENNIGVFAIDPATGEPTPIQFADPHGFHVRSFTIDPSGQLLIAALLAPMTQGGKLVPAGLSLFRIADDGRLTFARKYDIELAPGVQQMWVEAMNISA